MNSNYFSKNYGYLEKAMYSKSPQTVLHFWLIHKTSNSSHTTPSTHLYIISHRLAPESYSQIFAAESYLSPITATGNHRPPPRRWRSLADGNLCCLGHCWGTTPIPHHESHPDCRNSRKCTPWMEAGQALRGEA